MNPVYVSILVMGVQRGHNTWASAGHPELLNK